MPIVEWTNHSDSTRFNWHSTNNGGMATKSATTKRQMTNGFVAAGGFVTRRTKKQIFAENAKYKVRTQHTKQGFEFQTNQPSERAFFASRVAAECLVR